MQFVIAVAKLVTLLAIVESTYKNNKLTVSSTLRQVPIPHRLTRMLGSRQKTEPGAVVQCEC